jgi:hypothetical protein
MASARVPGKDPFAQLAKLAKEIQEKNGGPLTWEEFIERLKHYLINELATSRILEISPRTLQSWRLEGGALTFRKLNKKTVKYKLEDVLNFVEEAGRRSTSELTH